MMISLHFSQLVRRNCLNVSALKAKAYRKFNQLLSACLYTIPSKFAKRHAVQKRRRVTDVRRK
jgi:hypothetical protein